MYIVKVCVEKLILKNDNSNFKDIDKQIPGKIVYNTLYKASCLEIEGVQKYQIDYLFNQYKFS